MAFSAASLALMTYSSCSLVLDPMGIIVLMSDPKTASEILAYMAALRENSSMAVNHAYGTVILVGCATPSNEAFVCGGRSWKVDSGSTLRRKASLGKTTAGFKKRKEDSWVVWWANGVSTTLAVDDTPWASLAVYCRHESVTAENPRQSGPAYP